VRPIHPNSCIIRAPFQPTIVPFSVANRKTAGAPFDNLKLVVGLKTTPVGFPPGMLTSSATLISCGSVGSTRLQLPAYANPNKYCHDIVMWRVIGEFCLQRPNSPKSGLPLPSRSQSSPMPSALSTPLAADRVGSGSCDSAPAVHSAGPAMAAVAGIALEAIPGLGGASILAAGSWGDCCPRHSSAEV
jgi:hypothetical protein